MQTRYSFSLLLCCALGLANAAFSHPEYRVTIMAPAGSAAADINNAGVVVGTFPSGAQRVRGFINRGKGPVDLGLRHANVNVVAINDKDQVLGHWIAPDNQQYGFLYDGGKLQSIPPKRGWSTIFTDINNHGYITAYGFLLSSPDAPHGFLRAPNGTYRDIGTLPFEHPLTIPWALNNRNQVTGESGPLIFPGLPVRAFLWSKGTMLDLGDFGAEPNVGKAINDRGQVTGFASLLSGIHDRHAFLYSKGRLTDIDDGVTPYEQFSDGEGINNHGHIVGSSNSLSGFIYRGRRMESLNKLVDPALGWDIRYPQAINDAGQIAATAYRNNVQYAVRLDLLRPHALAAPVLDAEEVLETPVED